MTTIIFSVPPVKQFFHAVCEKRVGRVVVGNTYTSGPKFTRLHFRSE